MAAKAARNKPKFDGITCDPNEDIRIRTSLPVWAKGYDFTGSLRPTLLSPKRDIPSHIRRPDYADEPNGASYSEQRDRANNTALRIYGPKEIGRAHV